MKPALSTVLVLTLAFFASAQEESNSKPRELEVLKGCIGVWDAEIEVWPAGLNSPSIKFTGVETNRAYGEYWIASDFDSVYMQQTVKVHSIIGYDLDQKKLVGTVVDHGPYAASMTGDYDDKSKTVRWITAAKDTDGKPMLQKTSITQKNPRERVLVLTVPGEEKDTYNKFMQIKFVKRS